MRYFGGKTKTCKEIAAYLESIRSPDQKFLSPFIGGGWVEALIADPKLCCDKHTYLIEMYKELKKGWIPPTALTKEEYEYIRLHKDEKPYLTGFVGFGCSFAGKWFGGYAKEKKERNFCLNAHNSIMKKMIGLKNTEFNCCDYRSLNPKDMLIYCDPPYCGTTPYSKQIVGDFNSDEFWEVMRQWGKSNVVIISEYNAPSDMFCVWSKNMKLNICDGKGAKLDRIEKLFTPNNPNDFHKGHPHNIFEIL